MFFTNELGLVYLILYLFIGGEAFLCWKSLLNAKNSKGVTLYLELA
jgi:hypothetical protein